MIVHQERLSSGSTLLIEWDFKCENCGSDGCSISDRPDLPGHQLERKCHIGCGQSQLTDKPGIFRTVRIDRGNAA